MRKGRVILLLAALSGVVSSPCLRGQSTGKPKTFETASVKAVQPPPGVTVVNGGGGFTCQAPCVSIPRPSGGPGTADPGRIHYPLVSLKTLLGFAWGRTYFEIASPDWLGEQLVAVDATMAPKTSRDEFDEMLQNLVRDRFRLQSHVETKAISGYELVVTKGGPKLRRSVAPNEQEKAEYAERAKDFMNRPRKFGPDGYEIMPRGFTGLWQEVIRGRDRIGGQFATMAELAGTLRFVLQAPVLNKTGLDGNYDFTLDYSGASVSLKANPDALEPAAPDIFGALKSQLGLQLDSKKVPVEVMVVDRMERNPIEN